MSEEKNCDQCLYQSDKECVLCRFFGKGNLVGVPYCLSYYKKRSAVNTNREVTQRRESH